MGVLDSVDETDSDESSPTETAETVEQFRVVVEYSDTWRGDIRYMEDGNTSVRVPMAARYDDPDRIEREIPDDLEDPDEVGTIQTPITFTSMNVNGNPSEEDPFVAELYVEGEKVDSQTVTESGTDVKIGY